MILAALGLGTLAQEFCEQTLFLQSEVLLAIAPKICNMRLRGTVRHR